MNGKKKQAEYLQMTLGDEPGDMERGNTLMTTIPDYKLDPPKSNMLPPCPMCGAELYGYIFIDIYGDPVGCTECVRTKDPWEYVEMLSDEK